MLYRGSSRAMGEDSLGIGDNISKWIGAFDIYFLVYREKMLSRKKGRSK